MNRRPSQERKPAPKASPSSSKTAGEKQKSTKPSLDKAYGTSTSKTAVTASKPKPKPKPVPSSSTSTNNNVVKSGPAKPSAAAPPATRKGPFPSQRTTTSLISRTGKVDGGTREKSKEVPKVKPQPPPPEEKADDYEDDFEEDYQSDFEDDMPEEEAESPIPPQLDNEKNETSEEEAEASEQEENPNVDVPVPAVDETRKVLKRSSSFFGSSKPPETLPYNSNSNGDQSMSMRMPTFDFAKANEINRKSGRMKRVKELLNVLNLRSTRLVTMIQLGPQGSKKRTHLHSKDVQTVMPSQAKICQTLPVRKVNSWTQRPPTWSSKRADRLDIKLLREEALGVGREVIPVPRGHEDEEDQFQHLTSEAHQRKWEEEVGSSWNQITRFICRASRKMLYVLESQKRFTMKDTAGNDATEVKLSRSVGLLQEFDLGVLCCSGHFLAAANFYPVEKSWMKNETKTIISVWSLKEPSCPRYFLKMFGKVTAIAIFPFGHIVVAGGRGGGFSLWDLDASPEYHNAFEGHVIRTPNVDTSMLPENHSETLIGLEVLVNPEQEHHYQILSLDRLGTLKLWGVRRSTRIILKPENPKNTAYWSKISLTHKTTLQLKEFLTVGKEEEIFLTCVKLVLEEGQKFRLFCGTANGFLLGGSLTILDEKKLAEEEGEEDEENFESEGEVESDKVIKEKTKVDKPKVEKTLKLLALSNVQKIWEPNCPSGVTCFDYNAALNVCMVGSYDCKCRIYSCSNDAPLLLTITCKGPPVRVHCSGVKNSVFYVALQDQLCIYDLLKDKANPRKVVDLPKLTDLELYRSLQSEFTVALAGNELKVSPLAGELKALTEQEGRKLNSILGGSSQVTNGEVK